MTTFRQVIPNSKWNPTNERFEYYLVWLSIGGGVRSWLFSHTDGRQAEDYENFSIEGIDDIRSVPSMQRKKVIAETFSMNQEEMIYVSSIMASNRVYQVDKTGIKTPIALKGSVVAMPNKVKEFKLKIEFSFKENNILNV